MNKENRIKALERKQVEDTNTIEEFEYLLLTDYSVRADSYLLTSDMIQLYTGNQFEDIELSPTTFNTTLRKMKNLLDKYSFNELKLH